jgi:colanic acid/amylovoran biosynthesis glycosyltransferase
MKIDLDRPRSHSKRTSQFSQNMSRFLLTNSSYVPQVIARAPVNSAQAFTASVSQFRFVRRVILTPFIAKLANSRVPVTVRKTASLLYLIGQFPAINHGYLLAEVRHLRKLGFDLRVASVSAPDRPLDRLSSIEREEAALTYYVKSVPPLKAACSILLEFLRNPLRWLRGFFFALRLGGANPKRAAYHLAYFFEAVLVGRHMRRYELTHVHANFSATVALILTRTFPVTMSFAVHGFGELHNPTESHLADCIHSAGFVRSISRYGRGQMMLSCDRSEWFKLVYAPLGIDANAFVPTERCPVSSPARILCVGRLAPEKGQSLLLNAIAALSAAGFPSHLRLVGDGPDRTFLERRAAQLGIAAGVEFVGWVDPPKLTSLYADSDLFVLPSLAEGIPMVLMEAMAMQIPCVAPRITGIPELVGDGVEGMLYSVADLEELTAKIRALLESPELMQQIGKRARLRVMRDYDMARNTERFAEMLAERLAGTTLPKA